MAKLRPCPIKGCPHKWYSITGLGQHLFNDHNKGHLIKYILKAEAESLRLKEAEAHV